MSSAGRNALLRISLKDGIVIERAEELVGTTVARHDSLEVTDLSQEAGLERAPALFICQGAAARPPRDAVL
jgi:hypothetical protein